MSDPVKITIGVALVGAFQAICLALIAVWVNRINARQTKMEARHQLNSENIQKIELATNGMKKQLEDEARQRGFESGVKSETDKTKNE